MAYQAQPPPGYAPAPNYYPSQQYQPYPAPQPVMTQQSSSNVVVVQQPAAAPQVSAMYVERDRPNHLLHCVITFFCPWWIFIWFIICCIYGC